MIGKKKGIKRKKVFVGLSGGVDSAVSALLLKQAGYDVTGVFIKVWQPFDKAQGKPLLACNWREERRDAMRVALALKIPFLFFDFEEEYKKGVVDYMIAEYKVGRTPNPDVLCNKEIKFGAFWKKAREMGADYIATGHYAERRALEDGHFELREGVDKEKDQSYFLWGLTQEDLMHSLFPVGHLKKEEVRALAKKFNLPVADKKDSQGICFLGDVSMEEFLSHFIKSVPGNVLNTKGEIIGRHNGAVHYTIGERHGFEITKKSPESGAFYVVSKDIKANTITVSNIEKEIISLAPRRIMLNKANWITEPTSSNLTARIRYRGTKILMTLSLVGKKLAVELKEAERGISLGQSIVFYINDQCLGGAVIDRIIE